jgi:hypothetical protein
MTLVNVLNPLFQVIAALVIFVTGFFALFIAGVIAVLFTRFAYMCASWAVSKGVEAYSRRRGVVGVLANHQDGAMALAWRDRFTDTVASQKFR